MQDRPSSLSYLERVPVRLRLALLPRGHLGSAFSRHSLRLGTNNKGSRIARRFAPSLELYLSRPTQPAIFRVTSNKQRSSVQMWPVFGFGRETCLPRLGSSATPLSCSLCAGWGPGGVPSERPATNDEAARFRTGDVVSALRCGPPVGHPSRRSCRGCGRLSRRKQRVGAALILRSLCY